MTSSNPQPLAPHRHPAALYPARYRQRIYELMAFYNCYHSDAEGIAEVEYCELGHIPTPTSHEIPHH